MSTATDVGAALAARLGIEVIGTEGHDCKAACIACASSDGFRVHRDTGVGYCHSCKVKYSPWQLAETLLGDRKAARDLLVELGLLEPRNGHAGTNGAATDPIATIERAKGIPAGGLLVYGATVSGRTEVTLPTFGPDGKQCSTFRLKASGKGLNAKGAPAGVFLPTGGEQVRLPTEGERWCVVEGVKDAAALHSLGMPTLGLPTCSMAPKFARLLGGCDVVIVPDRDEAGERGAEQTAAALYRVARSIRIATLPAEYKPKGGDDCRDVLRRTGGRELLLQAIEDARAWEPAGETERPSQGPVNLPDPESGDGAKAGGERPEIVISTDEPAVVDEAIGALATDPDVFTRGTVLACVVRSERKLRGIVRPPDARRIVTLPLPTLREKMAGCAKWIKLAHKEDGEDRIPVHPPDWAVKAVAARGHWAPIRPIEGVVETPVLRFGGTILAAKGYDSDTGLLFAPPRSFPPIPDHPTAADVRGAVDALLEVVEDFPFAREAHRSGWIAGLLTPLARYAFHGPAPMFVVDANTRGTGKSLLTDAIASVLLGRDMARMVNPESDDEMRKRITTIAIEGERMVLLDNVGNTLGSPALDCALTATTWKDRVLGGNRSTSDIPICATWYANGNNLVFNGDTIRRVVPIRIETDLEKPEERTGFRHPELLPWIRSERPRLVAAALTVLRAFHAAGCPDQRLPTWGSYEAWSAAIREPIVWAGLADPADAREELAEQSDREAGALRALITGWQEMTGDEGATVAEVFRMLDANLAASRIEEGRHGHEPLKWMGLRAAIAELSGASLNKLPSPRSFGMRLNHLRGRVVGGKRFMTRQRDGTKVWRIEETWGTENSGTKGTTGTNQHFTPACARAGARETKQRSDSPPSPSSPLRESEEVIEWRA